MLTIRITDGRKTMTRDFLPTSPFTGDIFAGISDEWTDATTPRTDKPVRFIPSNRYRQTPPVVKRFPGDSFTIRWA